MQVLFVMYNPPESVAGGANASWEMNGRHRGPKFLFDIILTFQYLETLKYPPTL